VCDSCWRSVRSLASPFIEWRGTDGPLDLLCAIGEYDGRLRDIIHALKYEHRRSIARPLGELMREYGADLLRDADCVTPVPLHPRRERSRGFNQSEDLAQQLGLPIRRMLRRVVATRSQIDLPANERHANVRNAFEFFPAGLLTAPRAATAAQGVPSKVEGRRIVSQPPGGSLSGLPAVVVVVDDVSTTGATLLACAGTLKRAGVSQVRALTAARVSTARR
jgi:predicted amidophosphoribosyltransferase